ncbi:MAG TPA: N-acetyltransferase [Verrucomicrobia bacterium]|mgnify:CR=1 FL=1|nr:N-acetyltransferase [Verrucomicrobiota bacterium]
MNKPPNQDPVELPTVSSPTRIGDRFPGVEIRHAHENDVPGIAEIINYYARSNLLLPRSEASVAQALGGFLVASDPETGALLGTSALHPYSPKLAEVRSLTVHPEAQGLGIGSRLVRACMEEAKNREFERLFALTYQIVFFHKLGFQVVSKQTLPEKVWSDCIYCPRYYDCSEVAMMILLATPRRHPT